MIPAVRAVKTTSVRSQAGPSQSGFELKVQGANSQKDCATFAATKTAQVRLKE